MVQYKKDDVQRRILDAAAYSFIHKGVVETRMADIAKAAYISVGNLYRYYENKEALVEELCPRDFVERIISKISEILTDADSKMHCEVIDEEVLLSIKESFDEYLFLHETEILIAANQESYFNAIKDKVISFMSRIIMEQYSNCPMMEDHLKETTLLMIYENLVDITFKIIKTNLTEFDKKKLLRTINRHYFKSIIEITEGNWDL